MTANFFGFMFAEATTESSVLQTQCQSCELKLRHYGRTLSDASMLYFADVFYVFFYIPALVGQTAERIFTKLSHVVDIRCYLRTY